MLLHFYFISYFILFRKHTISFSRASRLGSLLFKAQSAQVFLSSSWRHCRHDPTVKMTTTEHKTPKFFCCKTQTHGAKQHFGIPPSSRSSPEEARHSQKAQMFSNLGRSVSCCKYHLPTWTCWQARVFSAWHTNLIDSPKSTVIRTFTYTFKV